ncbi:hypothetical protein PCK1_001383 [Pneumocystis canis]|nr:hypothetical protein PCK1_001383 [Pneumocystis canis]
MLYVTDHGSLHTEKSQSPSYYSKGGSETEEPQGDELDFLTPRDVSIARYMRHHDWMEEILNSNFKIEDILSSPLFPKSPDFTIDALKKKLSTDEIQTMKHQHNQKIKEIKFSEEAIWLNNAIRELNNAKTMEDITCITKTVEENLKKTSVQRVLAKKVSIKEIHQRFNHSELLNV